MGCFFFILFFACSFRARLVFAKSAFGLVNAFNWATKAWGLEEITVHDLMINCNRYFSKCGKISIPSGSDEELHQLVQRTLMNIVDTIELVRIASSDWAVKVIALPINHFC
eukprot:TRINITY_DN758069_c0_g1_i1.p1 TRINITY_DN758069_c0_g1~~TRINITY_DN758069_c0_g1_i1.p1  ORF type:complete len:111 (-),score=9.79 TRINITY_DN758069_c0_g1_i1:147-479(-)